MTRGDQGGAEDAIRDVVHAINDAWRHDRLEELERLLCPDVVFVAPGLAGRIEGLEACIQSYCDFLSAATVHDFRADEPVIDVFGDAAVASFHWTIDYTLGGTLYHETGYDLLVLVRDDGGWRGAWRTLVTPSKEP